jgi:hypothetical protein
MAPPLPIDALPAICVFEKLAASGTVVIMPEALQPGEAAIVAGRLRAILGK